MIATLPDPHAEPLRLYVAGQPASVAPVRRALSNALRDWGVAELAEDMELIAGELVGNAVRHAANAGIGVLLRTQGDLILLEVADGSTGKPVERQADADDEDGRGLLIVRALAEDCGWRINERGGTTVWATLPLPAGRTAV